MNSLFDSVAECLKEINCPVDGELPEWLNGQLIRVGPGKFDFEKNFCLNHFFDGCAIIVKFRITNGQVFYTSKFLQSESYKKLNEFNKPVFTEFGTRAYPDPSKGFFSRVISQLVPSDITDNAFQSVCCFGNDVCCVSESCHVWRLDANTLDGKEKINLEKTMGVNIGASHPRYSASDHAVYNLGISFMSGMRYHIIKIPLSEKAQITRNDIDYCKESPLNEAKIVSTISSSYKTSFCYMHSFGITDNYIVLIEPPSLVNGFKLATSTPKGKSFSECIDWHPNETTKFHLINKTTGERSIMSYQSKAFFYLHTINAYELNDQIILDIIIYDDMSILSKFCLKKLRANEWDNKSPPSAKRFVIPLGEDTEFEKFDNLVRIENCSATAKKIAKQTVWLEPESLGPAGFELPTINGKYTGKNYRYVYGSGSFERGFFSNSICKLDLRTKEVLLWKETDTTFPGEIIFVGKPESKREDEGILLSVVCDSNQSKSNFLLMLDATDFSEIARAEVPRNLAQVPITIHGTFI